MSKHKGHVRQRSAGSWEIRYSWTDPLTRKRKTATATVRGTYKQADAQLRERLSELDKNRHVDPSRVTVAEWLEEWLGLIRGEVAAKTHERYGELVRHYLSPELGSHLLQRLEPIAIKTALAKWASGGRRDKKPGGLAPQTRHNLHTLLKIALNCAVAMKKRSDNPIDAVDPPTVPKKPMTVLTPEQSTRLLATIRHTRMFWPVLITLATGMRRGEVLGLRWGSVDFERGVIRVVESLEETKTYGLRLKTTKTDRWRAVTLPAFAIEELRRHKKEQAEDLLRLGIRQRDEAFVCPRANPLDGEGKPDKQGAPLSPDACSHEFARLVRNIPDMPRVSLHKLRHSHASQLLLPGVHPKVVQERLGHSSITVTLDTYSHLIPTMQGEAASRLDAAYKPGLNGTTDSK